MQASCDCNDACHSLSYTAEVSMSTLSERSAEFLLDHNKEDIRTQYRESREIRERVEPERLAGFLKTHREIHAAIKRFLDYTNYIASTDATSLRSLAVQAVNTFSDHIVRNDTLCLLDDIDNYNKAYKVIYEPRRKLIIEQVSTAVKTVTFFLDLFYLPDEPDNTIILINTTLNQLLLVNASLYTLSGEEERIKQLFQNSDYLKFKPSRLHASKKRINECKKSEGTLTEDIGKMMNVIGALNPNDSGVIEDVKKLHDVTVAVNGNVSKLENCFNDYSNIFTESVADPFYLDNFASLSPDIKFNIEKKHISLLNVNAIFNDIEIQITAYTKSKLAIAGEMNESFVAEVGKRLDVLLDSITTDIFDEIVQSVNSIKSKAVNSYNDSLAICVQMQKYFTADNESEVFEERVKRMNILLAVRIY